MVRAPFYDKSGLKKGAWSSEEDARLRAFVQRYGHSNWRQLPKLAGLARCGKSCRLRWLNYLRPNLKHGNYTQDEEELIIKLHQQLGNRWSQIAEKLPGRTDNEVKNHWHSHLKKVSTSNNEITTSSSSSESLKSNPGNNTPEEEKTNNKFTESESPPLFDEDGANNFHHVIESSLPMSSEGQNYALISSNVEQYSSMNCPRSEEDGVAPLVTFEEIRGDFWTEPFLVDRSAYADDEIISSGGQGMGFLIPYLFHEATDFYF